MVALLAEGVDRNLITIQISHTKRKSPSSRRAWIEIVIKLAFVVVKSVALLAEGVDRNFVNDLRNVAVQVALLAEGVDRNNPD